LGGLLDPSVHVPQHFDNVDVLCKNFSKLIIASQSDSTWQKHMSAYNAFKKFNVDTGNKASWPASIETMKCFIVWCIFEKKLKHSTAESYVSSIQFLHKLQNLQCENFLQDRIVKNLLTGGENVFLLGNPPPSNRTAMNLSMLMVLGHKIAKSNWGELSKQVLWACCTTAFFTSARMGELLAQHTHTYDDRCTLLWKNIVNTDSDDIVIQLPYTKTKGLKGEVLDLFVFNSMGCCPVKALNKLKKLHIEHKMYSKNLPVFTFGSGKFLTTCKMNELLGKLLEGFFDDNVNSITCHSFRAAIPTCIANHPDKSYVSDLKEWGRWEGNSYKLYTKLEQNKKRSLFKKITNILLEDLK
jgi:hypothetical protein